MYRCPMLELALLRLAYKLVSCQQKAPRRLDAPVRSSFFVQEFTVGSRWRPLLCRRRRRRRPAAAEMGAWTGVTVARAER
jgi:hypothetical protein